MTKIFVVSKVDDWSDNRNVGVFSTREAAAEAKGDYIEEWILDNQQDAPGHYSSFEVIMDRDGFSRSVRKAEWFGIGRNNTDPYVFPKNRCLTFVGDVSGCAKFNVWAKDAQHAIKIVNEKRAQLIAEGKWQ